MYHEKLNNMQYRKYSLLFFFMCIPLCLYAQGHFKDCIGKNYISKKRSLIFSGKTGINIKNLEGNIDFVCIGESEDIYGNKCGVFQAVSDSTLIFHSPGHFNNFDYFISKAEYDDLCKEYGLKSMSRALNGETFKGMPIALFIIARGNPSSTRRIETKYGNTEILVYEMTDGYTSYIFKNGKLSATDENYY